MKRLTSEEKYMRNICFSSDLFKKKKKKRKRIVTFADSRDRSLDSCSALFNVANPFGISDPVEQPRARSLASVCVLSPLNSLHGCGIIWRWLPSICPQAGCCIGAVWGDACRPGSQRAPHQRGHGPGIGSNVQRETHQTAALHHQRQPPPSDPGTLSHTSTTVVFSTPHLKWATQLREALKSVYDPSFSGTTPTEVVWWHWRTDVLIMMMMMIRPVEELSCGSMGQ